MDKKPRIKDRSNRKLRGVWNKHNNITEYRITGKSNRLKGKTKQKRREQNKHSNKYRIMDKSLLGTE